MDVIYDRIKTLYIIDFGVVARIMWDSERIGKPGK